MEKESDDEFISMKKFERAGGIDLGKFMVESDEVEPENIEQKESKIEDQAMGEIAEIFSREQKSEINRDGTVEKPPEMDSVTELAVEGEKRLHFGLMISMIVVWSAIGTVVGLTLTPLLATLGLLSMALFGIWLGEIWIPQSRMHLLGVTWVIISMKLLYGLAISMHSWEWLNQTELGIGLLSLVALNIVIAQRYDEDAIATQATIVLLAIGSAAGGPYGQEGVALMIGIGTILFHSLAYFRQSGNLASLGIAVSYLWIGVHAISDNWNLFGIELKAFEDELLLFLLMFSVTSINAIMATKFAKEENWFSSAFKSMGLGKPGLWSVSVGLGMIGALLAIASNRLETGYALAQLILLISAFAPSYLVVRGVEWKKLVPFVLWPAPLILCALILMVRGLVSPPVFDAYSIYAIISAIITVTIILNHQKSVSDHVLWIGSIVLVILLTLLIDAKTPEKARNLIICQSIVWIGLSWLSLKRDSPSLAGTAVIAPWIWILLLAGNLESRIIANDLIPIAIDEFDLAAYMVMLVILQIPINLSLGDSGVNLAGRLAGLSELSARMRDSGYLRLWNIGFICSLFTLVMVSNPDIIPAIGLVVVMSLLLISHSVIIALQRHQGTPGIILVSWALAAVILQWRFGFSSSWISVLVLCSIILMREAERNLEDINSGGELSEEKILPDYLITTSLGFIAAMLLILGLNLDIHNPLNTTEDMPQEILNLRISVFAAIIGIATLYLPRASKLEKLLPSAIMSLSVIVISMLTANSYGDQTTMILGGVFFIGSGSWLAAQGEIRARAKQVSKRDERLERHLSGKEADEQKVNENNQVSEIKMIDAEMIQLAEQQKKRSKRRGSSGEYDLIVGDIQHKPTIVVSFIVVTMLFGIYSAWVSSTSVTSIAVASFIAILFIAIARWRAQQVNLQLPDIMGIESPVAISMAGLTLIKIAGRLGDKRVILSHQWELLILLCALIILGGISLVGRKDLGLRIPSVLEGIVLLVLVSRILTTLMGIDQIQPLPTTFDDLSWTVPVISVEIFLVMAVLLFQWVESERIKRDLGDHRGVSGRITWALLVVPISFGIAGLLVCILSIKNSLKWMQPGVSLGIAIIAPISWNALGNWISIVDDTTAIFMMLVGIISIVLSAIVTLNNKQIWLTSTLWISHILLPSGAFGQYEQSTVLFMASIVLLSGVAWTIGIVTMRRTWRVIGALDLIISWIIAGFLVGAGVAQSMLLIMLIITAILLGIVTWLGQKYEPEITNS